MVFNPDPLKPVKAVIFSNKNAKNYNNFQYSGTEVIFNDHHKHLGLVLDNKLSFVRHIDTKIKKASQGVRLIKRLHK